MQVGIGRYRLKPDIFLGAGAVAAVLALAPIAALGLLAFGAGEGQWRHLAANVIPDSAIETLILSAGVLVFVVVVGTACAWIVSAFDFPGRRIAETLLLLPLAFPIYVLAYAWLDLTHPVGPLQTGLRALLGYARPADFRLPDLRTLPGAVLIYGLALYPYVYVAARAVFLSQMTNLAEAARMLGKSGASIFFRIALPLARPALAAGGALALMETLNDIGAAEFLSINTLTAAVYSTWVNRSDLPGAAQIALAMLVFVLLLVVMERVGRGGRSYAVIGRNMRPLAPRRVAGPAGLALAGLVALPALFGFMIPAAHLLLQSYWRIAHVGLPGEILVETGNSLLIAVLTTLVCLAGALMVVGGVRLMGSPLRRALLQVSAVGYALPGTVLAIGLLVVLGGLDSTVRALAALAGFKPPGLLFSASLAAIVLALSLRFFRLATSKIEAGLERLSPSLDNAARTLGRSPFAVLREIHAPLLKPTIAGAGLLVFVDCMKELPATLLLRPLNFETLSTHLYGEAARGTYENGALAACLIVAFGLLPVALLTRLGRVAPTAEAKEERA